MKIWLDTINVETIEDGVKTGVISGVTTNPSILSKSHKVQDTLTRILELQNGPLAVQVTSDDASNMIEEGTHLFEFSNRIVVKVPVTKNGLVAMRGLYKKQIPFLGTAILHPSQALLAANLGAAYISPYLSHIGDIEILRSINLLLNSSSTQLLAASVKTMDDLIQCALMHVDAVTIKDELYFQLVESDHLIEKFTEKFQVDWKQMHGPASIKDLLVSLACQHETK